MTRKMISGVVCSSVIGALTVATLITGQFIGYSIYKDPFVFEGALRIAEVLFLALATMIAGILIMMFLLGVIAEINEPKIGDWGENKIVSNSIKYGVAIAGMLLMAGLVTNVPVIPTGTENTSVYLGSAAVIAIPLYYVGDQWGEIDKSTVERSDNTENTDNALDAEYVKERTKKGNINATSSKLSGEIDTGDTTEQTPTESEDGETASLDEYNYQWKTETKVSFNDIGGLEDLKEDLRRDIILPLTGRREKAEELGVTAPNVIFYGPPGTGKTFTAKAVATEVGLPFAKLSGADIQSKWINESAEKVKQLFDEAKAVAGEHGGAIVFLDELDSVLKTRDGSGGNHEEDNKVVNEFLNHLEDTDEHNIVFIGATNRVDSLDEAGIRSGRIDRKIRVGKPDAEARMKIFKKKLQERPHDLSDGQLEVFAEMTAGVVAADIESIVEQAAKKVLHRNGDSITESDVTESIETIIDENK